MYRDESNGGGGEPHGPAHGPAVTIIDVSFIDIDLSLPDLEAVSARPSGATFAIEHCDHGIPMVYIQGCLIAPMPTHVSLGRRLRIAWGYLTCEFKGPPHG